MKRRYKILIPLVIILLGVIWWGAEKVERYDIDGYNFRLRYIERWEFYERPLLTTVEHVNDHEIAQPLREHGLIPAFDESKTRWLLIKGFRPWIRGWSGAGKMLTKSIGSVSFGTPVPLPLEEGSDNHLLRLHQEHPEISAEVWQKYYRFLEQDKMFEATFLFMELRNYIYDCEEKKLKPSISGFNQWLEKEWSFSQSHRAHELHAVDERFVREIISVIM